MSEASRYEVVIDEAAAREIRKLPRPVQTRVMNKAAALADNPRPHGSIKLTGADDLYRVRVGDYRIVYQIADARRVVIVLIVAHRRDVYRGL